MEESKVVALFHRLDEQIETLQKSQDQTYLDCMIDVLRSLHEGEATTLQVDLQDYETKQLHRAIQLLLLKGMKENTQANHMLTPEAIALFIGYLVEKFTDKQKFIRIFNPGSGTGNLLFSVLEQLEDKTYLAYACEIDETLIQIALHSANLLEKEVEFFHQDCLRPLLLDPVDIVVADLPVGYYPDDEQAKTFSLYPEAGHAYAHHLFIEQSLQYTKPGGYLIFLIPEFLFTSDQAELLHKFLHQHAHIIGVLQLAATTFKSKTMQKSILILRKKGEHTKNVKQPLLVMLPSLKETNAMENILAQINQWFNDMRPYLQDKPSVEKGE